MRKYILSIALLLMAAWVMAETQPGYVRTIERPGRKSVRLEGVMIRARGSHNAVMTSEQGAFTMLLPEVESGQAFALSSVVKSGYELQEKELIGRRMACSSGVELEICMVSKADLMADKAAIEEKARENIERYYSERLAMLEKQLAEKSLTAEQYESQLTALEEKYDRFEPLLDAMSDRYARTDYAQLDELTQRINTAIEMGDLDEAERLIQSKGNLAQRQAEVLREQQAVAEAEKRIAEARREADKRRKELADDYYHLYTIALSRFDNDSARTFIEARAALDTMNAEYQYQAGQFYAHLMADYETAERYFQHALRVATLRDGEESAEVAVSLNELGLICYKQKDRKKAMDYMLRSLDLNTRLWGENSKTVAENLSNLSALYCTIGDNEQAIRYAEQALEKTTALYGEKHATVASIQNNIGSIYYRMQQPDKAIEWLLKALNTNIALYGEMSDKVGIAHLNLGVIYSKQGKMDKAITHVEAARDIFLRVYGTEHPLTKNAENLISAFRSKQ